MGKPGNNYKTNKEKYPNYFTYIKHQEKAYVNKNQKLYVKNIKSAEIANATYNSNYYNVNKSDSFKAKLFKIIIGIVMIILSILYFKFTDGNIVDEFFSFIFASGFGSLLVIYGFVV